ncbi:MAG: hypothetical protein CBC42_07075 [Betaproteobacteria bacterium TMED82]|nr:MAG: hypothetical protein CBC42_07075 [Betaproteobacteria bacterium TMED82]
MPEFKHQKLRIMIIGYGDIAGRIIKKRLNKLCSRNIKFLTVSRSELPINIVGDEGENKNFNNHSHLKVDLDNVTEVKRILPICSWFIILVPTKKNDRYGMEHALDDRANLLSTYIKYGRNKRIRGVYVSTTGVYGHAQGQLIDETYKCTPLNKRSERRLSAEMSFRKKLNFHILRVPGIYASDRLPVNRLLAKKPVLNEQDDIYTNHINAEDLAKVVYTALFRGLPSRITNTIDDSVLKMSEYMRLIADKFGIDQPPRISIDELERKIIDGEISEMAGSFFRESRQIKNDRLKKELGVKLDYPTVEETLKSMD